MKPVRLVIARVCIGPDGRYSIDAPLPDQGGSREFGTVEVGQGGLAESLRYLEASLKHRHGESLDAARRFQERRDAEWR